MSDEDETDGRENFGWWDFNRELEERYDLEKDIINRELLEKFFGGENTVNVENVYGPFKPIFDLEKEGEPLQDNTTGGVVGATYIDIKEAAGLVAKSPDSIRRAIRSGKLNAIMARDGRYLIDKADVLKAFPQQPDGIKGTPADVLKLVALQNKLVEARAALETSQAQIETKQAQIETKQARIDELEADKAQLSRAFEVISDTLASQNRRGRPLMLEAEPRKRRLWRRGGN